MIALRGQIIEKYLQVPVVVRKLCTTSGWYPPRSLRRSRSVFWRIVLLRSATMAINVRHKSQQPRKEWPVSAKVAISGPRDLTFSVSGRTAENAWSF